LLIKEKFEKKQLCHFSLLQKCQNVILCHLFFSECIINALAKGQGDITMTLPVNRYGNQGEN